MTTSKFFQYEDIIAQFFPIVLAIFLGEWSDKHGRKIPLIIGLCGKLYYSIIIAINSYFNWKLEYVLLTATLPTSLTGSDMAIFASCFAYVSDITKQENRTFRIGILDAAYLCAMPLGIACGSYIFNNVVQKSFTSMFLINSIFVSIAILHAIINLKTRITPLQEAHYGTTVVDKFRDFFSVDWENIQSLFTGKVSTTSSLMVPECRTVRNEYHTTIKRNRVLVVLTLIAMFFYAFQREEKSYMNLYTKNKFDWREPEYSMFRTIRSGCFVLCLLFLLPIMTRVLRLGDFTIAYIGCMLQITSHLGFFFTDESTSFVIWAIIGSGGVIIGPIIRSIASKIVGSDKRGKMFAMLSMCENAVPIVSTVAYSNLYRYSLDAKHCSVFLLTVATQTIVFGVIGYMFVKNDIHELKPIELIEKSPCVTACTSPHINNNTNSTTINTELQQKQQTRLELQQQFIF